MHETFTSRRLTASAVAFTGLTALAGLTGCSSKHTSDQQPVCNVQQADRWSPTAVNFNAPAFAHKLSVTPDTVLRQGEYGSATCPDGLSYDQIGGMGTIVTVTGESTKCVAFGVQKSEGIPTPDKPLYHNIIALCIRPDSTT